MASSYNLARSRSCDTRPIRIGWSDLANMEDTPRSLLQRLRETPDAISWKRLVDLYTPFLQRVLGAHAIHGADADDLLQEVFQVVTEKMPEFFHSGNRGAFRHWLRRVLTNRVKRFWKERQKSHQLDEPTYLERLEDPNNELDQLWEAEHHQYLMKRLMELIEPEFKPTTWAAFHRQVVGQAKAREVATELGVTVNSVLIAKSRVLRRMRQELQGLTDE